MISFPHSIHFGHGEEVLTSFPHSVHTGHGEEAITFNSIQYTRDICSLQVRFINGRSHANCAYEKFRVKKRMQIASMSPEDGEPP